MLVLDEVSVGVGGSIVLDKFGLGEASGWADVVDFFGERGGAESVKKRVTGLTGGSLGTVW